MKSFTATKEIAAQDIPVKSGRPLIAPPVLVPASDLQPEHWTKATMSFGIDGVKPVEMLDKELDDFWAIAEKIAMRAPNLKNVTPVNAVTP